MPDPSFLDVEDEDQRQKRISSLLERLNVTSPSASATAGSPLHITDDKVTPGPIKPPSELLARIQAFLPSIEASNNALARENPEDIDIENVGEDEEQYIEMNLGLGVFESTRPKTRSGSEDTSYSSEEESESESNSDIDDDPSSVSESDSFDLSSGDDSDPDDDDEGSDSDTGSSVHMNISTVVSRQIKPLPRRVSQQAKIEVLSSLPAPKRDADVP